MGGSASSLFVKDVTEVNLKVLHISLHGSAAVYATAAFGVGTDGVDKIFNKEKYVRAILQPFQDLGGIIRAWRGGSVVIEVVAENDEVEFRIREACGEEILKQINERLCKYKAKYPEEVGRFDKIKIIKEEKSHMSKENWNEAKNHLKQKLKQAFEDGQENYEAPTLYEGNVFEDEERAYELEEKLCEKYQAARELNETSTSWLSYLDQHVDPEFNKCFHKAKDEIKIELATQLIHFKLLFAAGSYWKLRQAGEKIWQIIESDNITTVYQLYRRAETLWQEDQMCEATLFFDLTAALALKTEDVQTVLQVSNLCLRRLALIIHKLLEAGGEERLIVYTYVIRVVGKIYATIQSSHTQTLGSIKDLAWCHHWVAVCNILVERWKASEKKLLTAISYFADKIGGDDKRVLGYLCTNLGHVYCAMSKWDQAKIYYKKSLQIIKNVGDFEDEKEKTWHVTMSEDALKRLEIQGV